MKNLDLSEIIDGLYYLEDNWLEQIQDMCDFIICERNDQANMEDEA